jgi:hypothetical protein
MARLIFECEDQEGHRVYFETSEKEGKDLIEHYDASKQWLTEHGFALVKARETAKPRSKEKVRFDGLHCPRCQGALWDNRSQKQGDASKTRWPDFSCRDKAGCQWAVWPGQYEIVESTD